MHVSLWIIYVVIVMIVPDIVQNKWKSEPSTIDIIREGHTQLEEELQTTRSQLEAELQTTRTQLEEDLQTTRTQLGEDLQTEKVKTQQMKEDLQTELEVTKLKLLNTEARLKMVEQTITSILSKLNV